MWKVRDQLRNGYYNAGLDQGGSIGDEEKWLISRYILMLKSIGLCEGLKWGVKIKGILNDSQVFDLSNQKFEVAPD